MVLLLLASQYQHHSLVGPAPTPVGFHCSSAVLIIQGAGSGLPVTRLLPSPGFCSTKTHSTTQPLPPHHPPTTPANFIGPGTAHTSQKNRAGEWQANQLNCPDLQTLSPRVHPLPPLTISVPAHLLGQTTVKIHCSGALLTKSSSWVTHLQTGLLSPHSVRPRQTPPPNYSYLNILPMASPFSQL